MDVVISSGNTQYFDQLSMFVNTLRAQGQFAGDIIICDNFIEGSWNQPESYRDGYSFTEPQIKYFKQYNVKVVAFSDLLKRNGISRSHVEAIKGKTARYPYKFFYCALISKEYVRHHAYKIAYFDSDILFQDDISKVSNVFSPETLCIAGENSKLEDSAFLSKWLQTTNLSNFTDNSLFHQNLLKNENYCSGFIGGTSTVFNSFFTLALLVASNSFVTFHTDQPLTNILIHHFNYPIQPISWQHVLHLSRADNNLIQIEEKGLVYQGKLPAVVHFNGGNTALMKDLYEKKVIERSALVRAKPTSAKSSAVSRIKRFLKK